ncbi:hypothetical protein [Bacillus sp. Marseille-P3800]|uniref:hypothetical protein n=1 Tax=Bacillus sp. Marseille-P3800 TaxID=2014782 RepID=UPI000C07B7BE|nr:hypothetical protein [Bacillus sp. Marseille-P3800]
MYERGTGIRILKIKRSNFHIRKNEIDHDYFSRLCNGRQGMVIAAIPASIGDNAPERYLVSILVRIDGELKSRKIEVESDEFKICK